MTDLSEVYWYGKIFRYLFAMLDKIIYGLVSFVMEVFYLVAGAEINFGNAVSSFFNRIQLILGVIILFKLVISLLSGIVNPDSLKDDKKGAGNVIKRVIIVLVMILLIVPLNIPAGDTVDLTENANKNSQKTWNARMNESGILFGTMAELQSRILNGDVIPKLVLGKGSADTNEDISVILLKNFIFVNLKPGVEKEPSEIKESDMFCQYDDYDDSAKKNKDFVKTVIGILTNKEGADEELEKSMELLASTLTDDSDSGFADTVADSLKKSDLKITKKAISDTKREALLESVNYYCDIKGGWGGERYIFVYKYILSTIAGILCFLLILSLTFDVATRVFKLLILRLISPVAILSYIDSKTEKTFNNWVKAVGTTYADLFIRLTIVSFVLLLITLIPNVKFNVYSGDASAMAKIFARIVLYLGLLFFAREAPKFITETLGIDSKDSKGLFSGLGKAAATVVGGITTARMGYKASLEAAEHNEQGSKDSRSNKAKALIAGLASGATTAAGTAGTYDNAKDHKWRTTFGNINKANAYRMQNAAEGATWWGGVKDQLHQDLTGDSHYARLEREEKDLNDKIKLAEEKQKRLNRYKDKAVEEAKTKGLRTVMYNRAGECIDDTNLKDIAAAAARGEATGRYILGGTNLGNKDSLDNLFNYAVSHTNENGEYSFAGGTYHSYDEVKQAYQDIINRGDFGGAYYAGGIEFESASEFSEFQAQAVDEAVNRINNGTAQLANGTAFNLDSEYETMRSDVRSMLGGNANFTIKDIKNEERSIAKDIYDKQNRIASIQPEKARAKGKYRGTDGQGNTH